MPRIVVLAPRFLRRAQAVGARSGSALSADVGRVVRELANARALPLPGDVEALLPPVRKAHVRRVGERNLWLWYVATDERLTLVAVTEVPPVPMDDR